jgi:small-conductance mechanosensitive channel
MRQRVVKFLLCSLMAGMVAIGTLTEMPNTIAQILPLTTLTPKPTQDIPWWDLNKARPCGRMWCSHVFFLGGGLNGFTVAIAPPLEQDPVESIRKVEARAKLIQKVYASIYETMLSRVNLSSKPFPKNSRAIVRLDWDDLLVQDNLGRHPDTPKIEVGVRNEQTVVYVLNQPEISLSQQSIATVTDADALYYGKSIAEVAQQWRSIIQESLSSALWGQVLDRHYPWVRPAIIVLLLLLFSIPLFFSWLLCNFLSFHERKFRRKLQEIRESLTQEALFWKEPGLSRSIFPELRQSIGRLPTSSPRQIVRHGWNLLQKHFFSTDRFGSIEQFHNLIKLALTTLFWLQVWWVFIVLASVSLVYPQTRSFVLFFTRQAFILPLIWMVLAILDKIASFIIDHLLIQWAKDVRVLHPNSTRLRLRVSTYSPALKGAVAFVLTVIGIYLTLQLYVRDPAAIASAGGIAVAIAFLSRNLLEDMMNGALILYTDRYALGDHITVNQITGLVESMTLYTTHIRGAEGRLVTIPNGKIFIVENLTKDWSRVELSIELTDNTDIDTACQVIDRTAAKLREDTDWKEKILEPASILGVDAISSQGIVLKVWIKTQPAQQWAVGREFRRRVKLALDEAGISLAVPRQEIINQ